MVSMQYNLLMTEPELSIIGPLSCCLLATMKIKASSIENTLTMFFLQESVNIMEGSSGSSSNPPGTKFLLLLFSFLFFTLQTDMTPEILNFLHSSTN